MIALSEHLPNSFRSIAEIKPAHGPNKLRIREQCLELAQQLGYKKPSSASAIAQLDQFQIKSANRLACQLACQLAVVA